MSKPVSGILFTVLLSWSVGSLAGFVEFSDRTTWEAEVGALENVGWDGYLLPPGSASNGWDGTDGIGDDITFATGAGITPFILQTAELDQQGRLDLGPATCWPPMPVSTYRSLTPLMA